MSDVLIVDDDDDVAELVAIVLEADGHRVRRAVDGRDGLRLLRDGALPDAIVLDVEMPRLTGPEMAYAMFVHDAGLENVPIVLVSGVVGLKDVARGVGTPYFLAKPVAAAELRRTLRRALRERRAPVPELAVDTSDSITGA